VAVHNYDVVHIKGNIGVLRKRSEFCVDMNERMKYKDMSKPRTMTMEPSYIWGYVSFGLLALALLGSIVFTWWALRKIWSRPVM
jgi:predicted FMN-binding regulatory protein PaiB